MILPMFSSATLRSFLAGATALSVTALAFAPLSLHATDAKPLIGYRADAATPPPLPNSKAGGGWRQARKPNAPIRFGTEEINGKVASYITPNPIDTGADNPDAFGSYQFLIIPEWISDSKGWTATAVVRVPLADSLNLHSCSFRLFDQEVEYMLSIFNDPRRNQRGVVLRSEGMELARSGGFDDALISFDVGSDYHTYQLYYNPQEEKLTLYIDGKEIASQNRSELVKNADVTPRIRWGKETAHAGEARWSEVRFELGKAIVAEKQ